MNDTNDGWVKLSRKLLESSYYLGEKFTRAMCWIDLILLAEWRVERTFYKRGHKITIKRGQVAVSNDTLAERWLLSKNTVRKRLEEMENDGRIEIQSDNFITIITICNYDKYQNGDSQNELQTEPQSELQTELQTELHYKNNKNIKKDNIISPNGECAVGGQSPKSEVELSAQIGEQDKTPTPPNPPKQKSKAERPTEPQASLDFGAATPEEVYAQLHGTTPSPAPAPKPKAKTSSHHPEVDLEFVVRLYHDRCPSLPKCRTLSETRKKKIRERFKEMGYSYETLQEVFDKAEASPFLRGERGKWKPDFGWFFENDNNWIKVLEGKYDDNNSQANSLITNGTTPTTKQHTAGYGGTSASQQPIASERQRMSVVATLAKIESEFGADRESECANVAPLIGLT